MLSTAGLGLGLGKVFNIKLLKNSLEYDIDFDIALFVSVIFPSYGSRQRQRRLNSKLLAFASIKAGRIKFFYCSTTLSII